MYDLHLHSTYSDGDWQPDKLLAEATERGLAGIALTDHNGSWGLAEAALSAADHNLAFVEGVEVSALHEHLDVHVLGYARSFDRQVLSDGLATTRQGSEARAQEIVKLCQRAGYGDLRFEQVVAKRSAQEAPCYLSYDVATLLTEVYGLSVREARSLTVTGGPCSVPYGEWALSPGAAIDLIHASGGVAVLAHPGTVARDHSWEDFTDLLKVMRASGLDGVEVYHPFHSASLVRQLKSLLNHSGLLLTGGSDWHGYGRYDDFDFGRFGVDDKGWQQLQKLLQ